MPRVVMFGLLWASCLHGATLELKNGKSFKAQIVYSYLDFVYVVAGPKPGDTKAVWRSDITAIKDETEHEKQLLALANPELAEFPQPPAEVKPRELSTAQLHDWYAGAIDFTRSAIAADKILTAEALIANYLSAENAKAATLLNQIMALKLPPEVLRAVLRHGRMPLAAQPQTGVFDTAITLKTKERQRRMQIAACVPENYSHAKTWPLIISLHGTRGHCANMLGMWQREKIDEYIVLAPWADSSHGWGPSTYGREQVLRTLEWAQTHYRIDPRRVFLDGFSMGGIGAKRLAAFIPDYFAGICCRSGPPLQKNLSRMYRNLHHMPFLSYSGEKDELNALAIIAAEKELCEAEKLPAKLYVLEDRGHDGFADRNQEVLDLFSRCERENMPDALRFSSYEDGPGLQHYYIEITEADRSQNSTVITNVMNILWIVFHAQGDLAKQRDTKSMVEFAQQEKLDGTTVEKRTTWLQPRELDLKVDRERNAVHIERAALVKALRIYVDDELLDLAKEIEVTYQGKALVKKTITPSPQFMLAHARKTGRRDITYWGAIDVRLER